MIEWRLVVKFHTPLTSVWDEASSQLSLLRLLYFQRKIPQHGLDRRLGGPQNWSGEGVEEKNLSLCQEFYPNPASSHSTLLLLLWN
jgi:hypothetical protein